MTWLSSTSLERPPQSLPPDDLLFVKQETEQILMLLDPSEPLLKMFLLPAMVSCLSLFDEPQMVPAL